MSRPNSSRRAQQHVPIKGREQLRAMALREKEWQADKAPSDAARIRIRSNRNARLRKYPTPQHPKTDHMPTYPPGRTKQTKHHQHTSPCLGLPKSFTLRKRSQRSHTAQRCFQSYRGFFSRPDNSNRMLYSTLPPKPPRRSQVFSKQPQLPFDQICAKLTNPPWLLLSTHFYENDLQYSHRV